MFGFTAFDWKSLQRYFPKSFALKFSNLLIKITSYKHFDSQSAHRGLALTGLWKTYPRKEKGSYFSREKPDIPGKNPGKLDQTCRVPLSFMCFSSTNIKRDNTVAKAGQDNFTNQFYLSFFEQGYQHNFNKYSTSRINSLGVPYDYGSVMHYGAYYFSKNGQPTIVVKKAGVRIFRLLTRTSRQWNLIEKPTKSK